MPKILVIEDDIVLRNELVDILEFEGYEFISANNGLDGLRMARELVERALPTAQGIRQPKQRSITPQ